MATCAEILAAKLPDDAGEDSFSILPLLMGKQSEQPTHPAVVHQAADGTLAIRRGKWKLVMGGLAASDTPNSDQLFDLEADLSETRDVAAEQADSVVSDLIKTLGDSIERGRSTPGVAKKNDVKVPLRVALPAGKKK